MTTHPFKTILALSAAGLLASCSSYQRLSELGSDPKLAPISNPAAKQPVSLPMPQPPAEPHGANSLWQPGARSFFHDPRASRIGDILTVNISVADAAKISNTTSRSRTNSDAANLTNFFGLEKALPSSMDPANLVNMGSDTSNVGAGSVDRSEFDQSYACRAGYPGFAKRQHGDWRSSAGACERRATRSASLWYCTHRGYHKRQHGRFDPNRRSAHLLWRARHGQRCPGTAGRKPALRHPHALVRTGA